MWGKIRSYNQTNLEIRMNRRLFLGASVAGAVALSLSGQAANRNRLTMTDIDALNAGWRDYLPDDYDVSLDLAPVKLSESQWRERLPGDLAFKVLRQEGTERAGSHPYNEEKRRGIFVCAGCQLPLFTSDMKYDSGTGWPSFFTHVPGHLETRRDFKLIWPRTEYHCIRCEGHQGHVFDDGPPPTGQRFCNNGVALTFLPA